MFSSDIVTIIKTSSEKTSGLSQLILWIMISRRDAETELRVSGLDMRHMGYVLMSRPAPLVFPEDKDQSFSAPLRLCARNTNNFKCEDLLVPCQG